MIVQHIEPDHLNSYLDDVCTDAEKAVISAHLAVCVACQTELHELALVQSALRALGEVPVPRSFAITPAMVQPTSPLRNPHSPAPLQPRRIEKIVRIIAIAAVLAFVALGTVRLAGWTETTETPPLSSVAGLSETNTGNEALQQSEPALAHGEVREQGDAAAIGANALVAQQTGNDTPAQADDSGLTPLEMAIIGVGGVALASTGCWILLRSRAGTSGI